MKLPRDLSGHELTRLLRRYGYEVVRQTGSHLRLTSKATGREHHLSIPAHRELKVGMVAGIVGDVASYLGRPRSEVEAELFGG